MSAVRLMQVYSMIGFEWTAVKFFWCVLYRTTQPYAQLGAAAYFPPSSYGGHIWDLACWQGTTQDCGI